MKNRHAVALGKLGGKQTAKLGPEHYRKANAARKVKAGRWSYVKPSIQKTGKKHP